MSIRPDRLQSCGLQVPADVTDPRQLRSFFEMTKAIIDQLQAAAVTSEEDSSQRTTLDVSGMQIDAAGNVAVLAKEKLYRGGKLIQVGPQKVIFRGKVGTGSGGGNTLVDNRTVNNYTTTVNQDGAFYIYYTMIGD